MKMVEDTLYNRFFIVHVMVNGNDRKIISVINNPSKGAQGQFLKSPKGKFDVEIPEPSLLAYQSHRVKVVAKHIFSIVNQSKAHRCGCTKADALLLKKDWG